MEATLTSNFRVYSFQGNTKLYAKYMNAIFGDQFYRLYILKISKNLNWLLVLKICFSLHVQLTLVISTMHNSILSLILTRWPGPGIFSYILLQFHNVYLDNG